MSIDDILADEDLAKEYYKYLQRRFKNGDLDEIIYLENSSLRGPRLSELSYTKMLSTIRNFLKENPLEAKRLQELASVDPFQITNNGSITSLEPDFLKSWASIDQKLKDASKRINQFLFLKKYSTEERDNITRQFFKELSHVNSGNIAEVFNANNERHKEALLRSLQKQYNRKQNVQLLIDISDSLLVFEAGPKRIEKLSGKAIPPFAKYLTLEDIELSATRLGKKLQMPGKVTDSILKNSSFREVGKSKFFKKGVTILPMTRMEAIFKSIGTGECVRTSCNRYIDAFFEDSIHMHILKNSEEIGYIGTYKTVDSKTGKKYWFVETIQSPLLDKKKVRAILLKLQQMAALDNSLLVLPSRSYSSYNYKEVIAYLKGISETRTGAEVEMQLRNNKTMDQFEKFAKSALNDGDQDIVAKSGYTKFVATNGLIISNGKGVIVSPLIDQPDWVLSKVDLLQKSKGEEVSRVMTSRSLSPLERARLIINNTPPGITVKFHLNELYERAITLGNLDEAQKIFELLYVETPKEFVYKSFEQHYRYIKNEIETTKIHFTRVEDLREELILKAKSWNDYKLVLELGERTRTRDYANLLTFTFHKYAKEASEKELLKMYAENLQYMPESAYDLELTKSVGTYLKGSDEFLQLVKMMNGEGIRGSFDNKNLKNAYTTEIWGRYYPAEQSWEKRKSFLKVLLTRLNNQGAHNVRFGFFEKASNLKEIKEILETQTPWSRLDIQERKLFSSKISKALQLIFEKSELNLLTNDNMRVSILDRFLFPGDKDDIFSSLLKKIKTVNDLDFLIESKVVDLKYILSLLSDEMLEPAIKARVIEHINNRPLDDSFFSYKGYTATKALDEYSLDDMKKLKEQARKIQLKSSQNHLLPALDYNLINTKEANRLHGYINFLKTQPLETQFQALEKISQNSKVSLSALIPEHQRLKEELVSWGSSLKTKRLGESEQTLIKMFKGIHVESFSNGKLSPNNSCLVKVLQELD